MRQVTLQIPDSQYGFFMELVKKLKFAKIASVPAKKLNPNQQEWVDGLKDALNEIQILDMELKQKDDIIKQLNDRVGTKDAMIESLEKRISQTQKLNNDYIEK